MTPARTLALFAAIALEATCACAAPAAEQNIAAQSISLDEFIDKSLGEEVPLSKIPERGAYRVRQVEKTIWRMIDRKGYYMGLGRDFHAWCTAHAGTWQELEAGANCADASNPDTWIAGYRIVIKRTGSYEGQMTAGYARIFFMRGDELKVVVDRERAEEQALAAQQANRKQCYEDMVTVLRTHPKPGMQTNLGMIVDARLPLVQVQDLRANPPLRWVEATQLKPLPVSERCPVTPQDAGR